MVICNCMLFWYEIFKVFSGYELLICLICLEDGVFLYVVFSLFGLEEICDCFLQLVIELFLEIMQWLIYFNFKIEIILVVVELLLVGEVVVGVVVCVLIIQGIWEVEYVILVSCFLVGQGLGCQLMCKLVKWVCGKYLDCFYGDVVEENELMKQLVVLLGFQLVLYLQGMFGLVCMVFEFDS